MAIRLQHDQTLLTVKLHILIHKTTKSITKLRQPDQSQEVKTGQCKRLQVIILICVATPESGGLQVAHACLMHHVQPHCCTLLQCSRLLASTGSVDSTPADRELSTKTMAYQIE